MSQFPNQPGSSPNPFSPSMATYQPPKSSNTWLWILLGVGGVFAVLCCGCGGFTYFSMNKGFEIFAQDLQARLSTDPVAQQHLGEIISVEMDFMAGVERSQDHNGKQSFLFHVKGSKGNADVVGDQPPLGGHSIENPILVLPSGEEIPLSF